MLVAGKCKNTAKAINHPENSKVSFTISALVGISRLLIIFYFLPSVCACLFADQHSAFSLVADNLTQIYGSSRDRICEYNATDMAEAVLVRRERADLRMLTSGRKKFGLVASQHFMRSRFCSLIQSA